MLRPAYIVLAHKNPQQVLRLLSRLDTENASFFVHVDRRSPDAVYEQIRIGMEAQQGAVLLPRFRCFWAGFGVVQATLAGIRAALASPIRPDYALLLSGQDYPIVPARRIEAFLERLDGKSYLDATALPSPRFDQGGLLRLEQWNWHGEVLGRRLHVPNRALPLALRRKLPPGLEPYAGSAYWCLSRQCLEYVTDWTRGHTQEVRFFRRVSSSDENFFQMVLMNSPLRSTIVTHNLHYIDWSERKSSPKLLTVDDWAALERSQAFFARKFDEEHDSAVLDRIDAELLR